MIYFSLLNGTDSIKLQVQYLLIALALDVLVIRSESRQFFMALGDIMTVSLIIMAVGYLMVVLGFVKILSIHEYHNDFQINNFGFFFVKKNVDIISEIRPSAYLDEPGSVSLLSFMVLLYFRSKGEKYRFEFILLLLPLITLSLSHFLLLLLFLLFFNLNVATVLRLASIALVGALSLPSVIQKIDRDLLAYINERSIARLEKFAQGEDDGRESGFKVGFDIVSRNYLGMPREEVLRKWPDYVVENVFTIFLDYGWILGVFYVVLILSFFWRNELSGLARFVPALFVLLFLVQRPSFIYVAYLLILMNFSYDQKESAVY